MSGNKERTGERAMVGVYLKKCMLGQGSCSWAWRGTIRLRVHKATTNNNHRHYTNCQVEDQIRKDFLTTVAVRQQWDAQRRRRCGSEPVSRIRPLGCLALNEKWQTGLGIRQLVAIAATRRLFSRRFMWNTPWGAVFGSGECAASLTGPSNRHERIPFQLGEVPLHNVQSRHTTRDTGDEAAALTE
ncbi:hypothetical protein VTI74DRAFT_6247 [Chaetomium olivicolor]